RPRRPRCLPQRGIELETGDAARRVGQVKGGPPAPGRNPNRRVNRRSGRRQARHQTLEQRQRLGRDVLATDLVPPRRAPLEDGHAEAAPRGQNGGRRTRWPTPDHGDITTLHAVPLEATRSAPSDTAATATPQTAPPRSRRPALPAPAACTPGRRCGGRR